MGDGNGQWWYLPKKFQNLMTSDANDEDEGYAKNDTSARLLSRNISYQQMISDESMHALNIYINILLCGCVAVMGSLTNVVNILVFYKMGLRESMSVYLFSLACTDFLMSFIIMVTRVFPIWDTFFESKTIDPIAVKYVTFDWPLDALYICSGWITTFLSLERCFCVTFPFHVRRIFTRNRSIVIVIATYVVVLAVFMPALVTHWLGWVGIHVGSSNGTIVRNNVLVIMFSKSRPQIEFFVNILSVTALPLPSLVIILVSVFWMVYGLRMSVELRSTIAVASKDNDLESRDDSNISYKTRRLMKVVLFLAIIFTICSIPRCFATYMNTFNEEVNEGGHERNLSIFLWQFAHFASAVNATVNIFVYVRINSNFRATFNEIFPCKFN